MVSNSLNCIDMKEVKLLGCVIVIAVILCACGSSKTSESTYYTMETTCIGTEMDGSLTVRAWGDGNSKKDAIEQAAKQAVYDVLFKNNITGTTGTLAKPVVVEANAREKYENYFNTFFKDGGEYRRYITLQDEKENSKQKMENRYVYRYCVTLRVLRSDLKARLQKDGIIK